MIFFPFISTYMYGVKGVTLDGFPEYPFGGPTILDIIVSCSFAQVGNQFMMKLKTFCLSQHTKLQPFPI